MFIFIPLALLLVSVAGISVVVYRKMPYLNKLTPESHLSAQTNVVGGVLADLLPELSEGFKGLKLKEYGNLWLIELEKFLRRLRVVSLKMDRISDSWIKKIRNKTPKEDMNPVRSLARVEDASPTEFLGGLKHHQETTPRKDLGEATSNGMKKEEQRLIIEIAKNPKDSKLYEILGDLYVKMNNLPDAKESFEAAIELSPHNEELQKKLSQVAEKLNTKIN
ncbi:MAG: hypothetical protein HYT64_01295 [Candidatus Yanofskybacteria bacterium]|nr:hypothetical protein [Candidatus Yanofskybacteria bacterium]